MNIQLFLIPHSSCLLALHQGMARASILKQKKQKPPHMMEISLPNKLDPIRSIYDLELAMLEHLQRGYPLSSNRTYQLIFS